MFTERIQTLLVFVLVCITTHVYAVNKGQDAPDFELLPFGQEEAVKLSDYKGKVVYLDFWASWCAPCRVSFPFYNELHQDYEGKDVVILAVSVDNTAAEAQKFLSRVPAKFITGLDVGNSIANQYQPMGMPTSYLINKEGKVVAVFNGFKESKMPVIRQSIDYLLGN